MSARPIRSSCQLQRLTSTKQAEGTAMHVTVRPPPMLCEVCELMYPNRKALVMNTTAEIEH